MHYRCGNRPTEPTTFYKLLLFFGINIPILNIYSGEVITN
jgi:hypothetical protein